MQGGGMHGGIPAAAAPCIPLVVWGQEATADACSRGRGASGRPPPRGRMARRARRRRGGQLYFWIDAVGAMKVPKVAAVAGELTSRGDNPAAPSRIFRMLASRFRDKHAAHPVMAGRDFQRYSVPSPTRGREEAPRAGRAFEALKGSKVPTPCRGRGSRGCLWPRSRRSRSRCPTKAGVAVSSPRATRTADGSTDAQGARHRVRRVAWYVWGVRGVVGLAARAGGAVVGHNFVVLLLFTPHSPPSTLQRKWSLIGRCGAYLGGFERC